MVKYNYKEKIIDDYTPYDIEDFFQIFDEEKPREDITDGESIKLEGHYKGFRIKIELPKVGGVILSAKTPKIIEESLQSRLLQ